MTGTQQGDQRILAALLALFAALAVVIAMIPFASPAAAQTNGEDDVNAAEVEVTRFAGAQRYETARLIAADAWETSDTVVIAKAETWPDALAGNYVAGLYDSPVLLVSRLAVQSDTLAALEDLGAQNLIVLGGEAAISEDNVTAFEDAGYEVDRVFGETRYETAAEITTRFVDEEGNHIVGTWEEQRTAIVATGQEFADALVSGPAAFAGQFPLLLTPRGSLHPAADAALDELEIERVIIPGGTAAVAAEVEAAIAGKDIEVTRVAGAQGTGRWGTATAFADLLVENFGFTPEAVDIATGFDFPDALTMGPHAGRLGVPLLLTNGTQDVPVAPVTDWLSDTACESTELHIAGGFAAVSQSNEAGLVAAAEACGTEPVIVDPDQSGVTVDAAANTTVTVTVVDTNGEPITGLTPADISYTDPGGTTETLAGFGYWLDFSEDAAGVYTATVDPTIVPEGEYNTTDWTVDGVVIEEVVVVVSAGTDGDPGPDVFNVALDWRNEVDPAAEGPVGTEDPTGFGWGQEGASGTADLTFTDEGLTFELTVEGLASAPVEVAGSPAHIHVGGIDENGGVVVVLGTMADFSYDADTLTLTGSGTGTLAADDPAVDELADIVANPSGYYVNVHSEAYPAGAVRGQLPDGGQNMLPEGIVPQPADAQAPTATAAYFPRGAEGNTVFGNNTLDVIHVTYDQEVTVAAGATMSLDTEGDGTNEATYTCGTEISCQVSATNPTIVDVQVVDDVAAADVTLNADVSTLTASAIANAADNEATGYPVVVTFSAPPAE